MSTELLFTELQTAVQHVLDKNRQLTSQLAKLQEQYELLQLEVMEKDEQQLKLQQDLQQLITTLSDNAG